MRNTVNSSLSRDEKGVIPKDKSFIADLIEKVFKGDKVIWLIFVILCVVSMVVIFSASSTLVYKDRNHWAPIMKHAVFLIAGFGLIIFLHNVPLRYYSSLIFLLFFSIILLLLTPLIGITLNEADRWIKIFGFTIQPSEFAKLSLMGTVAFILSRQNENNENTMFKWMIGLTVFVTVIIAKDNLSTAVLLFTVVVLMMFIGNVKIRKLLSVVAIGALSVALLIGVAKALPDNTINKVSFFKRFDTWGNRVVGFFDAKEQTEQEKYIINDKNYQAVYAKIAIANGGVIGQFPGNSITRDFLPQAYSDFIYAIILEELGLIGGIFVMLLYIIILIRAGIIAGRTKSLFARYLVMGSALMLSLQAFMNMAVAVGVIPVTGQPLPLISRGGTSIMASCVYFGIILSADRFSVRHKKTDITEENEGMEDDGDEFVRNIDTGDMKEKVEFTVIEV